MGVSRSRWGAYSGNWSWWWIQVEVTGGSLIMSSRRVTQQLLYFCSSGTWCLYLTCNKWRGSGSFFSSPQDNAIYCTECCSTLTNLFPCSVGNQYLPSLAWHSWLACIFYQHVILVCKHSAVSSICPRSPPEWNQQLGTRFSWGWAVIRNHRIYFKLQTDGDEEEVNDVRVTERTYSTFPAI